MSFQTNIYKTISYRVRFGDKIDQMFEEHCVLFAVVLVFGPQNGKRTAKLEVDVSDFQRVFDVNVGKLSQET